MFMQVSLQVRHNPCGEIQTLSLERQQSVKTPVYYHLEQRADELIGYIRLKEFNAVAKRDLVTGIWSHLISYRLQGEAIFYCISGCYVNISYVLSLWV